MSRTVCFRGTESEARDEARRVQPALNPIARPGPAGLWEVERDLAPGQVAYRTQVEVLEDDLERIRKAWKWSMDHLRYAAPEQYPIAAQEAFAHLGKAINS